MIDQVRAELLKVRSTRTTLGLLVGMIALTLLIVVLTGVLTKTPGLQGKSNQYGLFAVGGVGYVFAALASVLLTTSEYRHGTIRPTFLFTPSRTRVLEAKLIAGALTGIVFGAITLGISFGVGSLILSARGVPSALSSGEMVQLTAGGVGAVTLSAILGIGIGASVRNQVGAIIGLLAWDFVINSLLFGLAPKVGHFMPTPAADAIMGLQPSTAHLLGPVDGALVLVGWVVLFTVAAAVLTQRRDVT
jgi:ABC-2 type transport system permease protein